jgi:SAM-dependent methyltransferase
MIKTTFNFRILIRKFQTMLNIGLFRVFHILLDRIFLFLLSRFFKFAPWHSTSPSSARPYRYTVARLVNELSPVIVVEVGCGLGSILCLLDAKEIFGFDIDEEVIRCARFIRNKKIKFIHGDLSTVKLEKIDVLILVNWIHEISPEVLEELVTPLISRTKYLLLDAIDSDGPSGYRYKHDFAFLKSQARLLSITRPENESRTFHLFEVDK